MVPLTQCISASKSHLTYIALVGFLLRMCTFMNDKFGVLPKSFTTVSAKEQIDYGPLAIAASYLSEADLPPV